MSNKLNAALQTLRHIMGEKCEHYTKGLGSCYEAGLSAVAEDWADRCCDKCIAHRNLTCGEVPREEIHIDLATDDDTDQQVRFLPPR